MEPNRTHIRRKRKRNAMSEGEKEHLGILLKPWKEDSIIQLMGLFTQHGGISTYQHCLRVAEISFLLSSRLPFSCREEDLIGGAMLHDFFLYDWHGVSQGREGRHPKIRELEQKYRLPVSRITGQRIGIGPGNWTHSYKHPLIAAENADRLFGVSPRVRNIIESHMWPFNPGKLPRSREAWIVCLADKYSSLTETLFLRK